MLLVGCPSDDAAERWAERACVRLQASGSGFGERFGLSFGSAELWQQESPEAASELADRLMYEQKQTGYEQGESGQ